MIDTTPQGQMPHCRLCNMVITRDFEISRGKHLGFTGCRLALQSAIGDARQEIERLASACEEMLGEAVAVFEPRPVFPGSKETYQGIKGYLSSPDALDRIETTLIDYGRMLPIQERIVEANQQQPVDSPKETH